MRRAFALVVVVGCGRVGFDAHGDASAGGGDAPRDTRTSDADVSALLVGCQVWETFGEPAQWATGIVDHCGADNPGTASGGAVPATDPERGSVAQFGGGSACIQLPDAANLHPVDTLTVSAWIKANAVSPNGFGIVSKRKDFMVDTAYSVFLWADSSGAGTVNHLYVDIESENNRFETPGPEFLNAWRQVTVTFDGNVVPAQRVAIYVDGAFSTFAPESSTAISLPTVPPPVSIGCLPLGAPAQALDGRLDDVAIWNRRLSPAEVMAWYAATTP